MKRVLLLVLVLIILTGCYKQEQKAYDANGEASHSYVPTEYQNLGHGVFRFIDKQASVVCYAYYSDAMSCLPLAQTSLSKE